jgi:hypothetical protein
MGGASQGAARIINIPAADGGKCAKLSGIVNGAALVHIAASTTLSSTWDLVQASSMLTTLRMSATVHGGFRSARRIRSFVVFNGNPMMWRRRTPRDLWWHRARAAGTAGGFVSMRTRNFSTPLNLSTFDGIALRVRGDGMRYKLILHDDTNFLAVSYHASFDTVAGGSMRTSNRPMFDFGLILLASE